MPSTPLAVLDLIPIASGATPAAALRNTVDLAQHTERSGYARYWIAEHHLNAGLASTSPVLMMALTAAATSTIRIGSGAVLLGHRTALVTVEEIGVLDALHPGRMDLGLGNTTGRGAPPAAAPGKPGPGAAGAPNPGRDQLASLPLFALQRELLHAPGATLPDYGDQVADILDMLAGRFSRGGVIPPIVPGDHADPEVWILGSSAGRSATVAGENGLRFAASYHVFPSQTEGAVAAYRAAFQPSASLERPYVSVSADVVVGPDEDTARTLASGYGPWVHGIRSGRGALPFPSPAEARDYPWTDEARRQVADRVDTQLVGDPVQVADQLEALRDRTGADELVITTITHDHADRVRSYQLLAEEWNGRDNG